MTKQFTSDLKLKAVNYYHKIKNYVKVCEVFECSERSLKRWVERYDKNKNVDRKTRKLGSYKLENQHIQFIKETLRKHSDIQMNFLQELLKIKFPKLDISRQYLSDIIRANNITRKRATFKHFPKTYRGNIRNEQQELKEFFDVINKFKLEDIISIDETSVSTSLTHNYCRAFLGDRCIKKTTNNEVFKKYSLVVAINNKKCIASELYQNGAVNAERFNEFLNKICSKVKGKLFVLDNGQIHKKESTKQIIKESGNYLVYTCPYHPRLNSIEQFFNQMKHYIKLDKPKTFIALDESVKTSIDKIKPTNYENYFIYAYNKDYYKNKLNNKKYTKRRTLKIYKDL
jgi:transposase